MNLVIILQIRILHRLHGENRGEKAYFYAVTENSIPETKLKDYTENHKFF